MSTTSLGGTMPLGFFDDQPEAVIHDPNGSITNVEQQLHPFSSFVHIIKDNAQLTLFLQTKSKKKVVLIQIFLKQTRHDVIKFINNYIYQQQSIRSLSLFFIDGQQHEVELQNRFPSLLIDCYSITNDLYSQIQDVLSTTCDLYIKFCSQRVKEEKDNGNNSVAFIYEQQSKERLKLQIIHNSCRITEIDKDH